MKINCKCGKMAVWFYGPGDDSEEYSCCDDCVPRGCTCNDRLKEDLMFDTQEEYDKLCSNPNNFIKDLDEQGREYPCCEWWYDEEGWDDDE